MAFRYAINKVNADERLLPNFTLGYMAFDTCSNPEYGADVFTAFDRNLRLFSQKPDKPILTYIYAFIGAYDSDVTMALNRRNLEGYNILQVLVHYYLHYRKQPQVAREYWYQLHFELSTGSFDQRSSSFNI